MKLSQTKAEIWVPDGTLESQALARTTHLGIAAHQDDVEIMALEGILAGFGNAEKWFTAVIVTNGAGSPRDGLYAAYTDEQMQVVRRLEQKKAAYVGDYSAVALLDHSSSAVKDPANSGPKEDVKALISAARPEVIYTHNLGDKHDTHVAVALRVIAALRELPREERPRRLYGCEVWRDLDWMNDHDKVVFNLDPHQNIAASLVGVFDSQIAGGKRYDLATLSRRRAHATYHQSHAVDVAEMMNFAMDLTPLVTDETLDPAAYVQGFIRRFADEVSSRVRKLT
jgi:LmbE family N-acetylglucosaminyl deacetylase